MEDDSWRDQIKENKDHICGKQNKIRLAYKMSEYLSKRMSQGMEQDPGSPEILQELIDVS